MVRLLVGRVTQAVVVVLLVVTATFVLIRLAPGDPFSYVADDPVVSPDARAELHRAFGFDEPLPQQFVRFVAGVARGDLGWSTSRNEDVRDVLAATLPNTLLLMATGITLGLIGGILLGAWQGWRPESWSARVSDRVGIILLATPEFVLALLMLLIPAGALGLFPVGRMRSAFPPGGFAGAVDLAHHLVLPALTVALVLCVVVARHQRAAMVGVRDREFIRAARAKGVPEHRVFVRHALRNALVPVLTLLGVILPALFGGAVLVERIFSWPGMGQVAVAAVTSRDYHLVVACALVSSVCVVAGTLIADLAVLWADPRLRSRR